MSRQAGAKNRPKTIGVKLSDLNSLFKPEAIIEVSLKYKPLFEVEEQPEPVNNKVVEADNSLSFTVT